MELLRRRLLKKEKQSKSTHQIEAHWNPKSYQYLPACGASQSLFLHF
jgi:hypothetical protein